MPARSETGEKNPPERKRYPSRPKKGTVSDIKEAFKKMEDSSSTTTKNKKAGKKLNKIEKGEEVASMNTIKEQIELEDDNPEGESQGEDNHDNASENEEEEIMSQQENAFTQTSQSSQDSQEDSDESGKEEQEEELMDTSLEDKTENNSQTVKATAQHASEKNKKSENDAILTALKDIRKSLNRMEEAFSIQNKGLKPN